MARSCCYIQTLQKYLLSLVWFIREPDILFHNYRASKSVDRLFLTSSNLPINGFWGIKLEYIFGHGDGPLSRCMGIATAAKLHDVACYHLCVGVPDRPFHNFRAIRRSPNFMKFTNVVRWILKLNHCERVGRVLPIFIWFYGKVHLQAGWLELSLFTVWVAKQLQTPCQLRKP